MTAYSHHKEPSRSRLVSSSAADGVAIEFATLGHDKVVFHEPTPEEMAVLLAKAEEADAVAMRYDEQFDLR